MATETNSHVQSPWQRRIPTGTYPAETIGRLQSRAIKWPQIQGLCSAQTVSDCPGKAGAASAPLSWFLDRVPVRLRQ